MDSLISGLVLGGLYALVAQSFILTFLTTKTLNFAVGEFMACGAFLALGIGSWGWLPVPLKVIFASLAIGLLGAIAYQLVIRPFVDHGPHDVRWLLTTVGLSSILLNLLLNAYGASPRPLGYARIKGFATVLGVRVPAQALLITAIAVAVTAALALAAGRTRAGVVMRAMAEDSGTAALMGISPGRVSAASYAVAMSLAGLAGVLWSAEIGVSTAFGTQLLVGAFAVAVIGGLTSLWGVLVGGAVYGVLTQVAGYGLGSAWGETAGLLVVVIVLVFRPEGLLGRRLEEKV